MVTTKVILKNPEEAQQAVKIAVQNSIWFSVEPLPFDEYELSVKPEAFSLFSGFDK